MSSDTTTEPMTAREAYLRRQAEENAVAAAERLAITKDRGHVLGGIGENQTIVQVCNYLGISSGTLNALVRLHGDELREAGYVPAHDSHAARYSRRAILHLGMLLRPNASDRGVQIKKALGVYVPPASSKSQRWSNHVTSCKAVIAKAGALAEAVQEEDPQEVWNEISQMDRWQLQAVVVALGAIVDLDGDAPFRYLAELGDKIEGGNDRADHGKKGHVGRGLASLIPATRGEFEATRL